MFNTPEDVDKLSKLKKVTEELYIQALENLDKVLLRDMQIKVLMEKTEDMNKMSLDLVGVSEKVRCQMCWKNAKVKIAVGVLAVLLVFGIVWVCCGVKFERC